ncbi:hypothetical protein [Nocardioides sp. NPDC047086]|uniref:hypothetical protein n=1 Tax=Nocardioides sp. NPDC047086 TaxID=3154810 RepID=UPI0034088A59
MPTARASLTPWEVAALSPAGERWSASAVCQILLNVSAAATRSFPVVHAPYAELDLGVVHSVQRSHAELGVLQLSPAVAGLEGGPGGHEVGVRQSRRVSPAVLGGERDGLAGPVESGVEVAPGAGHPGQLGHGLEHDLVVATAPGQDERALEVVDGSEIVPGCASGRVRAG